MAIKDLPGIPGTIYEPGERKDNAWFLYRVGIRGKDREVTLYVKDARSALRSAVQVYERLAEGRELEQPRSFSWVADEYLRAVDASTNEARYVKKLKAHFGDKDIGAIRQADIAEAANKLYPGCRNETKNRQAYTPAASVLHWAAENEWCGYIRVRKLKERQPERRRPKAGAVDKLLANTTGKKHALLIVLVCQGWRITETLGLRPEHVDLHGRSLLLYVPKVGKWKAIAMHPDTFEVLANLDMKGETVFPWKDRHEVYKWLRPLCKKLGIKFTPHMARHDFASMLREQGATPRDLVDVGTWTSEKSTAVYDTANEAHKREIISRFRGQNRGKSKIA